MAGRWRSWGLPVIQLWVIEEGNSDDVTDSGPGDRGRGPMAVGAEPYQGHSRWPETAPERLVTSRPAPQTVNNYNFYGVTPDQVAEVVRRQAITDRREP